MSSRGQVVIPQPLRQAAGITEGDELDVVFDGQRLFLIAAESREERGQALPQERTVATEKVSLVMEESQARYEAGGSAEVWREQRGRGLRERRPSMVWADRVRALAAIKELRRELAGVDDEEMRTAARRELEERADR